MAISKFHEKCNKQEQSKIFKKYIKEIDSIPNKDEWFYFVAKVLGTIETVYSKDSTKYAFIEQLLNIDNGEDALKRVKQILKSQLESIVYEVKTLGIPIQFSGNQQIEKYIAPVINNDIQQHVNQTNNVDINIVLSVITNQLPPITMNEIKDIMNSSVKPEEKKNKIFECVKSTGENIIAKTLSELIWKAYGG